MKPARSEFWINVPKWTLAQFAFLRKGYEPVQLSKVTDENIQNEMKQELEKWEAWGTDCPGIENWDHMKQTPPILSIPVDARKLVNWASKKNGVVIPSELQLLLNPYEPETVVHSLGKIEKDHLLITVALLSKVIADNRSLKAGTVDCPNLSEISRLCVQLVSNKEGESTIPGMAGSTIRGRIAEGLKILKKYTLVAS